MKLYVTGRSGFVGKHVMRVLGKRGIPIADTLDDANAIIHLAWAGLPNYESEAHYDNVGWQMDIIKGAVSRGIKNITIAGTCLESVPNPPHYAKAKLQLYHRVHALLPGVKWVRLWYLYGDGQNENCLLPRLRQAILSGAKEFHVVDGSRDFIDVSKAAECLCDIATQSRVIGIIDCCSGVATPVSEFCRRSEGDSQIHFIADYPPKEYEPKSFHGTPITL